MNNYYLNHKCSYKVSWLTILYTFLVYRKAKTYLDNLSSTNEQDSESEQGSSAESDEEVWDWVCLDENPVCNELEESDQDLINYTFCFREKWPVACTSLSNGMKKNRRTQGIRNGNTTNMWTWRLQGTCYHCYCFDFLNFLAVINNYKN